MSVKINIKSIFLMLLILITVIPEGCKKYEDGPWISFRSKKNRLIGLWHVEEYRINNYDSTNLIKNRFFFMINYNNRDYDSRRTFGIIDYGPNGTDYNLHGEWDFLDNDKKFSMKFLITLNGTSYNYYNAWTGPFGTYKVSKWYIKRFTFDDFWLETDYEDNIYYLKLKKDESYVYR